MIGPRLFLEWLRPPRFFEVRNKKVRDAFNNISTLLGVGGPKGGDTAPRAKKVEAILDFAEASQWLQGRAP